MTSLERVQAVLRGEMPDRLPVVPQAFMFCAHAIGYNIGEINRNPAKLAESHIFSQEKYGYDGCVIDVDDATLAEACGAKAVFRDKDVASIDEHNPLLTDLRQINDLKLPDPKKSGRLSEWLEVSERLVDKIGKDVFIMGRADQGPFDLLCLLRGAQNLMLDLIDEDEEVVLNAMEWATQAHIIFAKAQLETGVHATSMGDAYAGPNLISPSMYRQFVFDFEKKVVESLKDYDGAYSIHICGDTTKIIEDMGKTGADILEIDWKSDMGRARSLVPQSTVLMGNIDPSDPMVLGTPEKVKSQVKNLIETTKGKGIIISSGCALGANTKPENMAALVEAAKLYGTAEQLMQLQNC